MKDFKQKFYDITALIQVEFDRNLEMYGDKIQCRRGCSKCCSQIFRITKLDGWMISEHVKSLHESQRNELQQKAREYLKRLPLTGRRTGFSVGEKEHTDGVFAEGVKNSDHPGSASHPSLIKEGSHDTPCPALGSEGECTIYEARPVICRRFGMPIYDYKKPQNVHACELNFKDGDEITDDKLIPNQTEIGMKWDELKEEYGEGSTTIAEAIANA